MQKVNVIYPPKKTLALIMCVPACLLILSAIAITLPYAPEPVGSRANIFIVGTKITIMLSLMSGVIGLVIGIIVALGKLSSNVILHNCSSIFVWLLRGTPLLTQILFVYYILPIWLPGLKLNEFNSALIALSFNVAAYNAEVVRAGIIAIPKGQFEAGLSLGLSRYRIMLSIIFPQAFRICIPALINNFIALIKDSSLASSIGLLELSLAGTRISSETFNPLPVLTTVTIIYLAITSLVSLVMFIYVKKNANNYMLNYHTDSKRNYKFRQLERGNI